MMDLTDHTRSLLEKYSSNSQITIASGKSRVKCLQQYWPDLLEGIIL